VKILFLSDKECPALWDYYRPGCLSDIDLIISCGDLKAEYLSFLVTMGRAPVMYVNGNHDTHYAVKPPEGCDCIDGELVNYKGIRILGMGGCPIYSGGPNQYTEREMQRRISKKKLQLYRAGGMDIFVTHAPAAGVGDGDDYAHRGFEVFNDVIEKYQPKYHVHGHVHMNYGQNVQRIIEREHTTVINAWERYIVEI